MACIFVRTYSVLLFECCNTHFPEAAANFAEKFLYQCFIPSICVMHCLLLFCVTTVLSDYPQCGFSWWTLCYTASHPPHLFWFGLIKQAFKIICHPSKIRLKVRFEGGRLFIYWFVCLNPPFKFRKYILTDNVFCHQVSSYNHLTFWNVSYDGGTVSVI